MDAFLLQIPGELSKSGYNVVSLLQKAASNMILSILVCILQA